MKIYRRPSGNCWCIFRSNAAAGPREGLMRRRWGGVIVWVAMSLILLFGLGGLAIDGGLIFMAKAQLQGTADAAATAAVSRVPPAIAVVALPADDTAAIVALAQEYAEKNMAAAKYGTVLASVDVVVGHWDRWTRTFTPIGAPPKTVNAVKVTTRRAAVNGNPLQLTFGRALGFSEMDVIAVAIARRGGGTGAGLIVLNPNTKECSLDVSGNVDLIVNDGAVQVNSNDPCAMCVGGNPTTLAADYKIVGDPGLCTTGNPTIIGDVLPDSPLREDPLIDLPDPVWDPLNDLGEIRLTEGAGDLEIGPGYYSGGIWQVGARLDLSPGIYILDGEGLYVSGLGEFVSKGAMFYLIGTGVVNLIGSGLTTMSEPDPANGLHQTGWNDAVALETYAGVTIFQARTNTNESTIFGSSLMDLRGTLYFPNAPVHIGGTGGDFGNMFIAYELRLSGSGEVKINYDGRYPAPGYEKQFLVH